MSSAQIIIILVAVVAIGALGYLRSDKNEYTERLVALDSVEAKNAEIIFQQIAKSTNYLAQYISQKASPVGQQMLLRSTIALKDSGKVALVGAYWSGEYLKVQVKTETDPNAEHWFTLGQDSPLDEAVIMMWCFDSFLAAQRMITIPGICHAPIA